MTTTNVINRTPDKQDYASPVQFRFKCTKLPLVEFFVQSVNLPGINLGSAQQTNPLYDIPLPGDKITYASLDLSFVVDENLNNYKEIHDWILGLGFPSNHTQFQDLQTAGSDRFPGSTRSTAATGTNVPQPLNEGGIYSDATLTVLNSKNIAKTEIRFENLYPTSLGSLNYDVRATDVDYINASVSFNYMNYDIVQISTT
jgi:hypothetical protein|tara:strand:- start:8 stop:607 length:600 start_codon:yes stop_codon:yes gene_type:complete